MCSATETWWRYTSDVGRDPGSGTRDPGSGTRYSRRRTILAFAVVSIAGFAGLYVDNASLATVVNAAARPDPAWRRSR